MWQTIWQNIADFISLVRPTDIIDILIVAYIIYKLLAFIRDTRALQLLKGIGILFVVFQISVWLNLDTVNFILRNAMQVGIIAILIVFQPEFRRALEQVGRSSFSKWFGEAEYVGQINSQSIAEIVRASEQLSKTRTGGLIVIERDTKIGEVISTGTQMSADVTAELLVNIFVPKTPLHDGAIVIRNNKIEAAACFLPLSQNKDLSKALGTRHRAGIGISEESDAVVVIVSEETGRISVAEMGEIRRNLTIDELHKYLTATLERERDKGIIKRNLRLWLDKDKGGNVK